MIDYKNGKIYIIFCQSNNNIKYIGSTTQTLNRRFQHHKTQKCSIGNLVRNDFNNDWSEFHIQLYELFPCETKKELVKRESEIIQKIDCINKNIPCRSKYETDKAYREKNKEEIKLKKAEYRKQNIEKIKAKNKAYRELPENKERNKEYQRKKRAEAKK